MGNCVIIIQADPVSKPPNKAVKDKLKTVGSSQNISNLLLAVHIQVLVQENQTLRQLQRVLIISLTLRQ